MAIATGLIAAGIGAAASIGGGLLSSKAQKKAAKSASQTEERNSAANIALARENYANNAARLDPYSQAGMRAGGVLSEMLMGRPAAPTAGAAGGPAVNWTGYVNDPLNSDALAEFNARGGGRSMAEFGQQHWQEDGSRRSLSPYTTGGKPISTGVSPDRPEYMVDGAVPSQGGALSAWDQFRNSTNYQFRLDEGNKAFTQGAFAKGIGESGAAIKGAINYNQQFAANELGQYQDRLAQQQQLGFGAASALAGVGQNMTNSVMASNNSAANAASNAALIGGRAQGQMFGSIAGALGSVAGAVGSSYGRPPAQPAFVIPDFNGLNSRYGG